MNVSVGWLLFYNFFSRLFVYGFTVTCMMSKKIFVFFSCGGGSNLVLLHQPFELRKKKKKKKKKT